MIIFGWKSSFHIIIAGENRELEYNNKRKSNLKSGDIDNIFSIIFFHHNLYVYS